MRKRLRWARWLKSLFVCAIVVEVIFVACFLIIGLRGKEQEEEMPRLSVKLTDTTLEEINAGDKSVKYPGNEVKLIDGENETTWQDVEIKGRGNYTWGDVKKPYRLKFDSKVDLFGIGKSRKWVLLTNNLDDSLLRNDLGLYIARMMGEEYASRGEFVWLDVDGKDLGVYQVVNPVEISKISVPLSDENGVLVELDNVNFSQDDQLRRTDEGDYLVIKDVVNKDNIDVAMDDFVSSFNRLEKAAKNKKYSDVKLLADVESFAEYYLISELTGNLDVYATSFYFYKDGFDDIIHAGPAWDFDSAFGNFGSSFGTIDKELLDPRTDNAKKDYAFGWEYYDEKIKKVVTVEPMKEISKLMYYLLDIPEFREEVVEAYKDKLSGKGDELVRYIDERASSIRDKALKDTRMWEKNDFDEAVEYLKWWVEQRATHMDMVYIDF